MIKYLTQLLRSREQKPLLAEIDRQHPHLSEYQGDDKINHYLAFAVGAITPAHDPLDYEMPALLVRALRYWTTRSATTYAYLLIEKIVLVDRLQQQVQAFNEADQVRQERESIILELADKTQEAIQAIQNAASSMDLQQRLN